jgi:hypothetical protein|tara:strand:+ start:457 stop:639 length:183 start_codon:yes stop_codon:yes gene_type:complete
METKERKYDMHKLDRDILVSASDVSKEEQEELNEWIDNPKKDKEIVDDLDNQYYSEGKIL